MPRELFLASILSAAFLAPALPARAEEPEHCPDHRAERQALFGDLHIHTAVSADANLFGTTNRPADAYRFARGETLTLLQPRGDAAPIQAKLARPLDFAAVTDHAESMGAISLCKTPGSAAYDTPECNAVRAPLPSNNLAEMSAHLGTIFGDMASPKVCGADGELCRAARAGPWKEVQDAALRFDQPCRFSTLIGYEHSPTPGGAKVHRNVIFRNAIVPETPIAWSDERSAIGFWRRLHRECMGAHTGCDAIAIPHNSNLSNGRMFALDYGGELDLERQAEIARLRASIERVVEIVQHKGDSECRNGMYSVLGGEDELCDFEKFRRWQGAEHKDCRTGTSQGALQGRGCVSRLDFARYALAAGVGEEARIGANPHKFGFIGSTDSHDGSAGDVDEWSMDGVQRQLEPNEIGRRTPGGLAGVWAEENTRESIFSALHRRETFGTSGPRIQVRFFGGWKLSADLCQVEDLAARGYAQGVPMGADLPPRKRRAEGAPSFVVSALRDPGVPEHPGGLLERIQIIKVWAGKGPDLHQAVYDVAGSKNDATVDPATCEPLGAGATSLCAVWSDPEFDPRQDAAYYARVLENPSCRYVAHTCNRLPEDARPAACSDESIPKTLQERAWTAPIWYTQPRKSGTRRAANRGLGDG
jgi:hypothetical protein